MPCARFTSLRAHAGKEAEVHAILDDVGSYQMGLEGWILGLRLVCAYEPRDIVGMVIWDTEKQATAAAQSDHVLALMARLKFVAEEHPVAAELFNITLVRGELPAPRKV